MQNIYLPFLCIILVSSCNSDSREKQDQNHTQHLDNESAPESDLAIYELTGKVKKCVETEYLAMEKNGQIVPEDSTIQDQYVYTFNKKGQLVKDQSVYEGVAQSTFIYHYDDNGKLLTKEEQSIRPEESEIVNYEYTKSGELSRVERKNQSGNSLEFTTYEYTASGQLKTAKSFENEILVGTDSFVYNEHGRLLEEHRIGKDDRDYYRFEYNKAGLKTNIYYHKTPDKKQLVESFKYDNANRVSFHRAFDASDNSWTSHSYTYHTNGNTKEEQFEQFHGEEELLKIVQKFNEHGLPVEEVSSTIIDGEKEEDQLRIQYELDANNNWIRQVVYENGQPSWLITRQIEYYD